MAIATHRLYPQLFSLLFLLLLTTANHGECQTCSLVTLPVLTELIPLVHPVTDGMIPNFLLQDFNVTCLSLSNVPERYRFTTISVAYTLTSVDNQTITALIDLGCSADNKWDPSVLGAEVSFRYNQPVLKNSLRMDCSMCISNTHPWNGNGSDPSTHCLACHSSCSVAGTVRGCTGPTETNCCLVYANGTCSTECSDDEVISENFTCTAVATNIAPFQSSETLSETSTTGKLIISTATYRSTAIISDVSSTIFASSTSVVSDKSNAIISLSTTALLSPSTAISREETNTMTFQTIQLSVLSSVITTLVTLTLVFAVTLLVVVICVCCHRRKCVRRRECHDPVYITSSEYVDPVTSPSTITERSLATADSISMNCNPAYYRVRYFGRPNIPPVVYEDLRQALEISRNNNTDSDNGYITVVP